MPTHQVSFTFTFLFSFSFIHSIYSLSVDDYGTTTTSVDVQSPPALVLTVAATPSPRLSIDDHGGTTIFSIDSHKPPSTPALTTTAGTSSSNVDDCVVPKLALTMAMAGHHQPLNYVHSPSVAPAFSISPTSLPTTITTPQHLPPLKSMCPMVTSTLNIVAVLMTCTYFYYI